MKLSYYPIILSLIDLYISGGYYYCVKDNQCIIGIELTKCNEFSSKARSCNWFGENCWFCDASKVDIRDHNDLLESLTIWCHNLKGGVLKNSVMKEFCGHN